jgi:hypothetical protein
VPLVAPVAPCTGVETVLTIPPPASRIAIVADARSPSGSEKEIEPPKIAGVAETYTACGEY